MVATSEGMAMGTVCRRIQQSLLMDGTRVPVLRAARGDVQPHVIRPGAADGRLVGGNLTMVASLLGTPWQIDTRGTLLFLEEIGEDPYRIDRTLTQLRLAGALHVAAGIILGDFHEAVIGRSGRRARQILFGGLVYRCSSVGLLENPLLVV